MATQYIERFNTVGEIPDNVGSGNHGAAGCGYVGNYLYVGGTRLATESVFGNHWYIAQDAYGGSDTNDGKSFTNPFATWAKVFDNISRGDVIHMYGWIASAAAGETTPQGTPDVTVIGHGGKARPGRDTDNEELGPKGGAAEWVANSSATAPNLTVTQQGWRFINIAFDGHASYPIIRLKRNTDGETLITGYNAGHAQFINCSFWGPSTYGIQDSTGNPYIDILGCEFQNFSTTGNIAIGVDAASAGPGFPHSWRVIGNRFFSNLTDINMNPVGGMGWEITHNHFKLISNTSGSTVTNTVAINMTGGRDNWIALNHMHGASNHNGVNARFVPGTNDMFAENYWSDTAEYAEPAS